MNIVFVRHHAASREFTFEVPDEIVPYIHKGQPVICETMYGLRLGTTTTGVISGEGALDVAIAKGAYFPLKRIVSFEHELLRNNIINECIEKLKEKYGCENVLPF